MTCGTTATFAGGCGLTISYPETLDEGTCLAINTVVLSAGCPASIGIRRQLSFAVTSHAAGDGSLAWRRGSASTNLLLPDSGPLSDTGQTTVAVDELVLDTQTVIEVVSGQTVLATLAVRSR